MTEITRTETFNSAVGGVGSLKFMAGKVPSTILFYQTWAPSKLSAIFSWDVVLKDSQHSGIYALTIEKLTHKMDTIYISGKIFKQGTYM